MSKTEGQNATRGQQARLRVRRAVSKGLASVGVSKPVAQSRNASATGGLPTVLLPWNLGSYEPMNNFHPLFRKWVETQTSVRFVRPPWAKELCQSPRYREDCSNTQYLEHGFGRVFEFEKAREFFSIQEFIFSSSICCCRISSYDTIHYCEEAIFLSL